MKFHFSSFPDGQIPLIHVLEFGLLFICSTRAAYLSMVLLSDVLIVSVCICIVSVLCLLAYDCVARPLFVVPGF